MKMKFSNLHKRELRRMPVEINLTNLVDITLNLLLAFMLMVGAAQSPSLEVSLPEADNGKAIKNTDALVVVITSDQNILVNNKAISQAELESMLKEFKAKNKGRVFLQADKLAAHGNVVQILDLIKKNGIGEVAIATSSKTKN